MFEASKGEHDAGKAGRGHETRPVDAGLGTEKEILDVVRDAMESKLSEEEDRRISGQLQAIAPPESGTKRK